MGAQGGHREKRSSIADRPTGLDYPLSWGAKSSWRRSGACGCRPLTRANRDFGDVEQDAATPRRPGTGRWLARAVEGNARRRILSSREGRRRLVLQKSCKSKGQTFEETAAARHVMAGSAGGGSRSVTSFPGAKLGPHACPDASSPQTPNPALSTPARPGRQSSARDAPDGRRS